MFLFLKMETSGLYRTELAPASKAQPWAISIAAEYTSEKGERYGAFDFHIKPGNRAVKPDALEAHGIDPKMCERFGVAEAPVLALLSDIAGKCRAVITYGDLDNRIVVSLLAKLEEAMKKREGFYVEKWRRTNLTFVDIQKPACQMECKLPSEKDGQEEFRWPTLTEAYHKVFGDSEPPNNAWEKLVMISDLFFHLRAKGHFPEVKDV
ncbi:MAG: hypothetical protein JJ979_26630 [Roseibium sp.]|nr:hypothetical protein [Roseibium sp.]